VERLTRRLLVVRYENRLNNNLQGYPASRGVFHAFRRRIAMQPTPKRFFRDCLSRRRQPLGTKPRIIMLFACWCANSDACSIIGKCGARFRGETVVDVTLTVYSNASRHGSAISRYSLRSASLRNTWPEHRRMPYAQVANRNVNVRFGTGRQKMVLERWTNPNFRVVRAHVSTGYNRVRENRRASRNGLVSDPPPGIPHVTIRKFVIAGPLMCGGTRTACQWP
jgi:hypothetical protein